MKNFKLRGAVAGMAIATASLLVAGSVAEAASPVQVSSCPSGYFCGTSSNVSGYVNPSNEWAASSGAAVNFAGYTYQDGNGIDNNVNSIRSRGSSGTYTGACFYWFAGAVTPKAYVSNSNAGWYDNSSTSLSSARWVTSSCI